MSTPFNTPWSTKIKLAAGEVHSLPGITLAPQYQPIPYPECQENFRQLLFHDHDGAEASDHFVPNSTPAAQLGETEEDGKGLSKSKT